jgi:serine protease inhibitor
MRVVLPAAGRFDEIRAELSPAWLESVDQAEKNFDRTVSVSLPKFQFDWGTTSFKKPLEALGMTDAFSGAADFTGMVKSPPLHVQDVLQKATIGVDESGTEAAVATAVAFRDAGVPMNPQVFDVDRPFLFMIHDAAGALLFVGQVTNPS